MRLHDPWLLVLLGLVLLLVRLPRRQTPAAVRFPLLGALRAIGSGRRAHWRWLLTALRVAGFALLVVALARPQLGRATTKVYTEGIDIMLAVDISGSMLAEDFSVEGARASRVEAVKSVVRKFVEGRPGDRIGLVLFAARPYTQCPLTLDHGWLLQNLARAEVGLIEDGTAVGSALATAVNRLEASDGKSKVIILLTDGQNNAGKVAPLNAADAAKTLGYRVYTVGAGTRGVAPYPVTGPFGNKIYQPMPVDIDEDMLRRVADKTGGRYFRATDTQSLEEVYAEIDRMEKSPYEGQQYMDFEELYVWFGLLGLVLLAAESVLAETWLRVLP